MNPKMVKESFSKYNSDSYGTICNKPVAFIHDFNYKICKNKRETFTNSRYSSV